MRKLLVPRGPRRGGAERHRGGAVGFERQAAGPAGSRAARRKQARSTPLLRDGRTEQLSEGSAREEDRSLLLAGLSWNQSRRGELLPRRGLVHAHRRRRGCGV